MAFPGEKLKLLLKPHHPYMPRHTPSRPSTIPRWRPSAPCRWVVLDLTATPSPTVSAAPGREGGTQTLLAWGLQVGVKEASWCS